MATQLVLPIQTPVK